jgi:hypothetical protein
MRYCCICNSNNNSKIIDIKLNIPNEINLYNTLSIYYCNKCYYYFNDNDNNQDDYNIYYLKFNNYKDYVISLDKDENCYNFLKKNIEQNKSLLDFGCGNNELAYKLKNNFNVDTYDIGMPFPTKKYNCIILSHVLEHIYDINTFIKSLDPLLIEDNGSVYIEVPNAEFYSFLNNICPLQEINLEHINFFSKYALNKLMMNHGYYASVLIDDFFNINNEKYYVIRGLFVKKYNNLSFENYTNNGLSILKSFNFDKINKINNIYIYGCGQLLFKILDYIDTNIINIIDDNPSYLGKIINNINIIDYNIFREKVNDNDTVIITSIISNEKIKNKINLINKNINIIVLNNID